MQAPLQARNDANTVQADTARTVEQKRVLADSWPVAAAQCKLAESMNNSPRVLQLLALSDAIHNSPRMVAQREAKSNDTGLPDQLKSGIESLSGVSMDHVKVHYNSDKPAQLQAHAYAQGDEIHLGAGQERHLPHEAWHVVQQAQGRVRPTLQMKAGAVNDDPSLEQEADMMGHKAAQFVSGHDAENPASAPIQRVSGVTQAAAAGMASTVAPRVGQNFTMPVAQLIRGHGLRTNNYKEVRIDDPDNTDVEDLDREEKTLVMTGNDEMEDENVGMTEETGYTAFRLQAGEQQADWQIVPEILHWTAPMTLSVRRDFNLPVSCIESAEHIIQSLGAEGPIPDYDPNNPAANDVSLHFQNTGNNANEEAVNISNEEIGDLDFDQWDSFDFTAEEIEIGQGLLVIDPNNADTSLHAVVVVGKNINNGQIIVVERNAGTTSGDNMYVDASWLVNVYASPEDFRASMGDDHIVGKLVAN